MIWKFNRTWKVAASQDGRSHLSPVSLARLPLVDKGHQHYKRRKWRTTSTIRMVVSCRFGWILQIPCCVLVLRCCYFRCCISFSSACVFFFHAHSTQHQFPIWWAKKVIFCIVKLVLPQRNVILVSFNCGVPLHRHQLQSTPSCLSLSQAILEYQMISWCNHTPQPTNL